MASKKDDAVPLKPATYNDAEVKTGAGGETHQTASGECPVLTTQQGVPVADDQNSLKVGGRGPTLLEDFHFREKIFHFDHERIPERVVHARGYGAHGYFENYESLADVTRADVFQRAGEKVPAFVRFSTVAGSKGSADLARDVRGFAVKLYTKEGNWDIVGNNIPVFFIQDAMKFPDMVHSVKPEPDRGFPQAQSAHDNFWDFISLSPESMHMVMWIMSDRAIPRSFRFMEGFGVHTFRLVNAQGKSTFVKFHWKPKHGMQSVVWNEAVKINGADPDFHRRDLWDAIGSGDFPEWELGLQLFDDAFAEVMFSAAVWSSNQDKLRPKVSCITRLAHPVDGRRIPGSRWGIDNPDSVYRVIPISGDERYEIHGRVGEHRMTENYFTLWDAHMGTVDVLNGRTMQVDPDGGFTITVDAEPAGVVVPRLTVEADARRRERRPLGGKPVDEPPRAGHGRGGGRHHPDGGLRLAVSQERLHRHVERQGDPSEGPGPRQFRLAALDLV